MPLGPQWVPFEDALGPQWDPIWALNASDIRCEQYLNRQSLENHGGGYSKIHKGRLALKPQVGTIVKP